jgi:hypothetical protein
MTSRNGNNSKLLVLITGGGGGALNFECRLLNSFVVKFMVINVPAKALPERERSDKLSKYFKRV